MQGINRVLVAGHLGQDPDCRATADGKWVVRLNVASTRKWKGADGEAHEETEWHRVVMFSHAAELARQYLKKGRAIFVEGRLQTREWEDKEGRKRWTTEIVAEQFQFLSDGRRDAGSRDEGAGAAVALEPGEVRPAGAPNGTSSGTNGATNGARRPPPRKSNAALADIPF